MEGGPALDVPWLEPYPDANLEGFADASLNPEARFTARESVQLAFVAAIQQLPPRQRAALMLCDVLGWPSAEAASLLDGSTASINSACSERVRHSPIAILTDGRRSNPSQLPRSKTSRPLSAGLGRARCPRFRGCTQGRCNCIMPPWVQWFTGARPLGHSLPRHGRPAVASIWCDIRERAAGFRHL